MLEDTHSRPSQIVCKVTTVTVTCMQAAFRVHEYSFTVLILLCKNNLKSANLPYRPSHFQKIKATTTTTFLISNTVDSNLYSQIITFDPIFRTLIYVSGQFNISASVWHSSTLRPSKRKYFLAVCYQQLNQNF